MSQKIESTTEYMGKISELKSAIKNTPPERLAKIEFQSHFLQIIGTGIVCGILIYKGFWYIIFAFIFSLGVSFSQGVGAYQKYKIIKQFNPQITYDPSQDKSFTRKRSYYVKRSFGLSAKIISLLISFLFCFAIIPYETWYEKILFSLTFLFSYVFMYFYFFYWISDKNISGGEND